MNSAKLAQATLIALTMQNQAQKVAPLSTAQMQGYVVNRNIAAGETVVCWLNNSGELTRIGDVPEYPAYTGNFFVDDNNLMYYATTDGHLVVCDAFSGDIINNTEVCLRFVLSGDNQIAAYCIEDSYEAPRHTKWVIIYKDGTRSQPITRNQALFTSDVSPRYFIRFAFGYRNGILAIANGTSDVRGYMVSTYTKEGILINDLFTGSAIYPGGELVCPINPSLVCIAQTTATNFWNLTLTNVSYYSLFGITGYDPCEGYHSIDGRQIIWIGTDHIYCYIAVRLCENIAEPDQPEEYVWLDKWDILRIAIDHYSVEKIKTINGVLSYSSYASTFGHVIQSVTLDSEVTRVMIDISTMSNVYVDALQNLPSSFIQENAGWIWIPNSGIYQKTPLDWLMSATGKYPRSSPWGKCGYAIGNYKIGQNGLAIVLFE